MLKGKPKEILVEAVEQMDVDLLVVGSRGLGQIKRYFLLYRSKNSIIS